jgi:hypothetical protein
VLGAGGIATVYLAHDTKPAFVETHREPAPVGCRDQGIRDSGAGERSPAPGSFAGVALGFTSPTASGRRPRGKMMLRQFI